MLNLPLRLPVLVATALGASAPLLETRDPLAQAALEFRSSLSAEQRDAACFPWADPERQNWQPLPYGEAGVRYATLDALQRGALWDLLDEVLSDAGIDTLRGVMTAEGILVGIEAEQGRPSKWHGPERYFVTLYGDPSGAAPWGLRFEGHHLSLNVRHTNGGSTEVEPFFVGSQPARIRGGAHDGLRVTGAEDDAARRLWESLDEGQRAQATLTGDQPGNVVLLPGVTAFDERGGIPASALTAEQQGLLLAVVGAWTGRLEGAASGEAADPHLEGVTFGWMGSTDPDGAHYWRIGGSGFWSGERRFGIEYSAPRSDPAHVHALWRALSSER
ncbi:MAG: DUF3500 domain-containing protein [Planctomycetota bacterium]|nr:DUF3500 domain-containing protein [Planctomycetota bacterium]